MQQKIRINEQIRSNEIRVIFPDGHQEVLRLQEALKAAHELHVDLVEFQPNANPPLCKLVDYGKFLYEQERRDKDLRKKQKNISVKEIRLHPNIDTHDFDFKINHAIEFLVKGGKVKVTVFFSGREIVYKDHGYSLIHKVTEKISIVGKLEAPPKLEGKQLYTFYVPEATKVATYVKEQKKTDEILKEQEETQRKERVQKLKEAEEIRKQNKSK